MRSAILQDNKHNIIPKRKDGKKTLLHRERKGIAHRQEVSNRKRIRAPDIDTTDLIEEISLTIIGFLTNPKFQRIWLLIPSLSKRWNLRGKTICSDLGRFLKGTQVVQEYALIWVDFSKEHKSCLHKLKLNIHKDENDQSCVTPWIDFVATPKLKHLEVEFGPVKRECLEVMPVRLFISETLLFLKLHRVLFGSFDSVSLPRLKTMRLQENVYANEVDLESLISSCPVLEDLIIVRRPGDNVNVLRVHSQTLITLSIENINDADEVEDLVVEFDYENSGVLIVAPRLKYLNLDDDASAITISNSGSLTKVNLRDFNSSSLTNVRNIFITISGIRDMNISWFVFECIEKIMPFSSQFCNLSCLEVQLNVISLEMLTKVLERCPNLKFLILEIFFLYCVKTIKALVRAWVFAVIARVCRDKKHQL